MKEKTGLKYTDGTDICEGDIIVLWHDVESQKKLIPYIRRVEWSDYHAGYAAVCNQYGWRDYLGNAIRDPNCLKVEKYVSAEAVLKNF
jgi:hypothetical protein